MEITSADAVCAGVGVEDTRIRPGLLKFRDEVIQTIPGVVSNAGNILQLSCSSVVCKTNQSTWLNQGLETLLTQSKQSVDDVAR